MTNFIIKLLKKTVLTLLSLWVTVSVLYIVFVKKFFEGDRMPMMTRDWQLILVICAFLIIGYFVLRGDKWIKKRSVRSRREAE